MPDKTHSTWRAYAARFRPHTFTLVAVAVAGALQSFVWLPMAWLLRRTFDTILPARDLPALAVVVAELLGLQVISLALGWWLRIAGLRIAQRLVASLRHDALARVYRLPRAFLTSADTERLHLTIVSETHWVEVMSQAVTTALLPALLSGLAIFAILFRTQPVFALVVAVLAPALFTLNRIMVRRTWFLQESARQALEAFSAGIRFALSALELTRLRAAEDAELSRQTATIETLRTETLNLHRLDANQQVVQASLLAVGTFAVLLAGGWLIADGGTTSGQIMGFYVFAALFANQARNAVESIPTVRLGLRAFAKVQSLLDEPAADPYSGTLDPGEIRTLTLHDADFSYTGATPLFTAASLEIHRGQTVALLGANGSGKSTLLYLLTGFYRPTRGHLTANGQPFDRLSMQALRRRMAVVSQHPFLFSDTVRANLIYGLDAEPGDAALWQALEWAGATDFVRDLPDALDTPIGESGVRLSGGQRQRLVIASALLRSPDVLILDEPTNHLDDAGIETLLASFRRLPFHPAIVLISHEARVLRHTTAAWRLSDGRLEPATGASV